MSGNVILQYLAEACCSLVDSQKLPNPAKVYFPNENIPIEAFQDNIYFQVHAGDEVIAYQTENTSQSVIVGSIIVNGKINVGVSLMNAVVDSLVWRFVPHNPDRQVGFTVRDEKTGSIANVLIAGVERTQSGTAENRFKTTIFITFKITEEHNNACY